jgi:integrase/recombinase XerD
MILMANTPIIQYKPGSHKGQPVIWLCFPYTSGVSNTMKRLSGCRWSRSQRCWYVPDTTEHRKQFGLAAALPERSTINHALPVSALPYPVNQHILSAMKQRLVLKAYSPSTIITYMNEMRTFLAVLKNNAADELTPQRLKDYFQYCLTTLQLSENTLHSRVNALKFYYEQVLGREKFFWEIPRPKKPQQLPKLFAREEIVNIIKAIDNLKHRTAILLCYSSGLRVSEVVALKVTDIDSKRMVIYILRAKGKKDRIVPLSKTTLHYLRRYYAQFKPVNYLFAGQSASGIYSSRAVQKILDTAKNKAGINRPGSVHALRHSYATHLLDKGVDITYIQKLLGHNDLKTTLRYLHVTTRDLSKIESPLEDLDL